MHLTVAIAAPLLATCVLGAPLEGRQSCPNVHVFGARETTAPAGYGSAGTFVNLILNAYPGSTAEAINYPAQGGTNSAYASSVQQGTQDIANQINSFNQQCPNTKLVVVGYSQVSTSTSVLCCLELTGVGCPNWRQCTLWWRGPQPRDNLYKSTHHFSREQCHQGSHLGWQSEELAG